MRNADVIKSYLDEVNKELIGSKKRKKDILDQLSIDLEDYAEHCGGELSLSSLENRFGSPQAAASSLLAETQIPVVKKQVNKRKAVVTLTCIFGIIALLLIVIYFVHDNKRKENFVNGYEKVTQVYNEQEFPDHLNNPPENAKSYYVESES